MNIDNYWLGNNELCIVYRDGTHYVLERDENYKPVFQGHYGECVDYCERRWIDYQESIIG